MLTWALTAATLMLGVALLLNVYRLVTGPDAPDRILALDTLYVNAAGLIIVYGIATASRLYFETALLIAALGFIGTVALAKYVARGDIAE
jgi:multicomponent K+:H+ antiporter subunit F